VATNANNEPVSDAELEVLKVLWEHGPGTVRDVEGHLPPRRRKGRWAYNTVLTLLSRLREKGYVTSDKPESGGGPALVFRATVTRGQMLRQNLSELADRVCDGTAGPLVHALVDGARNLSAQEISELRKLLDELERQAGKQTGR
jgi:predicted transcriptional regulator